MSSRTIIGALAALLIAGLAIAVPSLAATGKSDPKPPPAQSSSQQAAAKAKAEQAAADKAKAQDKPCPPASAHGQGTNGDHQDNGKHCGAQYPPQIGGH
ncbi:MAG: hypothetical protein QOJ49_1093 [Actinomycetota bacterium]|jgi:hypothetical protein|nr:hypothetical protein [Actinomycetota bacterium]